MARFSQRIGVSESAHVLQVDSMDDALRNSLWNILVLNYEHERYNYWRILAHRVAIDFRKVPADEVPDNNWSCMRWLKAYYSDLEWHEVYDFIEFVVISHSAFGNNHSTKTNELIEFTNHTLERELSGYRFIKGLLTPITDPSEVLEVETALDSAGRAGIPGAHQHIRTALSLFGKKPTPDYRNAIKEAISAVESVAKMLAGDDSATLDQELNTLASKVEIHGALKSSFSKLYGFTSDADGIRHAIMDQPTVGFTETKYMIIACSAFVNYLIAKAEQAGLLAQKRE